MEERILTLRCYNLLNANGRTLRMYLGRYENHKAAMTHFDKDQGYRWMFEGTQIPMPVRSGTWFNGFPENIMLDWLKGNGWALRASVDMNTGKATVYELPEPSKGNETHEYELPIHAINAGERALKYAVRMLYDNGNKLDAISLYRYVHPTCLLAARDAVDAIRFDKQQ